MNSLLIEFKVAMVSNLESGDQGIHRVIPTYVSVDKIKYIHKIGDDLARSLCQTSDLNPDDVINYTIVHLGNQDQILLAESVESVVKKLEDAGLVHHSRNLNG